MANFEKQKAEKLNIEDLARQKLDGEFLNDFQAFLSFLKQEKVTTPWKSINGFKMKYKNENIGGITFLGAGGWNDGIIEAKNYIHIGVDTAKWEKGEFDKYLDSQPDEIVSMFMEMIDNQCIHCRPTCGCSQVSGGTVEVAGASHQNICVNATQYKFKGNNLRELMMFNPRASLTPVPVRIVPLETVEKLILARKAYIDKISAEKNKPRN